MKKFLSIILSLLLVNSLCACSISDVPSTSGNGNDDTISNDNQISANDVVLVDNETIKVTYIGAKDEPSLGVFYVTLKIENKTTTDIVINLEDADVDGETIPLIATGVPLVIRPEKSGQTGFIFSMANLSIATMAEAEKATFSVVARNNDTYDIIYKSEPVTVNLN